MTAGRVSVQADLKFQTSALSGGGGSGDMQGRQIPVDDY